MKKWIWVACIVTMIAFLTLVLIVGLILGHRRMLKSESKITNWTNANLLVFSRVKREQAIFSKNSNRTKNRYSISRFHLNSISFISTHQTNLAI